MLDLAANYAYKINDGSTSGFIVKSGPGKLIAINAGNGWATTTLVYDSNVLGAGNGVKIAQLGTSATFAMPYHKLQFTQGLRIETSGSAPLTVIYQ